MEQYISKSALVAEIENKFEKYWKRGEESDALQDGNAKYWGGVLSCLNEVKTLINTLEVKEVDLEKEIQDIFQKYKNGYNGTVICNETDFSLIAKHFFELGIKAKDK